jgi:hypothetical protein
LLQWHDYLFILFVEFVEKLRAICIMGDKFELVSMEISRFSCDLLLFTLAYRAYKERKI